jgi:hypothetical protein
VGAELSSSRFRLSDLAKLESESAQALFKYRFPGPDLDNLIRISRWGLRILFSFSFLFSGLGP